MKVTVKTYGTVEIGPVADHAQQGLEVEIPDGANVSDLLAQLGISSSQGGTVVMEGRFLPKEAKLTDGSLVQVFQAMYGG